MYIEKVSISNLHRTLRCERRWMKSMFLKNCLVSLFLGHIILCDNFQKAIEGVG